MGKRDVRQTFNLDVRMSLTESDLDTLEKVVTDIQEQIRRLTFAVVAAALTLATASVLLGLNLIIGY